MEGLLKLSKDELQRFTFIKYVSKKRPRILQSVIYSKVQLSAFHTQKKNNKKIIEMCKGISECQNKCGNLRLGFSEGSLLNDTAEGGTEIGDTVPSATSKAVYGVMPAFLAQRTQHNMTAHTMGGPEE